MQTSVSMLVMSTPPDDPDPYAPPRADLRSTAQPRGAPLNAVLVGFLIVFVGTSIGGAALRMATLLGAVQMRFDHAHLAIALRIASFALGCATALAGGYACARIAGRRELALGAVLGALTIALGYLASVSDDDVPRDVRFMAIAFGLVLLGSFSGLRQNRR